MYADKHYTYCVQQYENERNRKKIFSLLGASIVLMMETSERKKFMRKACLSLNSRGKRKQIENEETQKGIKCEANATKRALLVAFFRSSVVELLLMSMNIFISFFFGFT